MDRDGHTLGTMETTASHDFLMGEVLALSLLGRIFYAFPKPEWVAGLAQNGVFQEAPLASEHPEVRQGMDLARRWLEGRTPQEAAEVLESDYIRLFVGGGRNVLAPPWESVYVSSEPLLLQKETLEVRNWYARYGLEAANKAHEPDDHAGLEMEFLAHLAGLALEALNEADESTFQEAIAAQQAFLQEHVLRWIPVWCGHVVEHARTDFFRGAALITRGLLAWVAERLGSLLEKAPSPDSSGA